MSITPEAIRERVEAHKAQGTKRAVCQRALCELSPPLADVIREIVADVYTPVCECAAELLGNAWHTPGCPVRCEMDLMVGAQS